MTQLNLDYFSFFFFCERPSRKLSRLFRSDQTFRFWRFDLDTIVKRRICRRSVALFWIGWRRIRRDTAHGRVHGKDRPGRFPYTSPFSVCQEFPIAASRWLIARIVFYTLPVRTEYIRPRGSVQWFSPFRGNPLGTIRH